MNTIVSFELAKLLKEKGFNELQAVGNHPTITEVVMWLYEKYDIWIEVSYKRNGNASNHFFNYKITLINTDLFNEKIAEGFWFNTPTEAYEAAIKYCLNNLINQ